MKTNELKELMTLIEQSPIDVLKLEKGDFKLYYQKQNATNFNVDFGEDNTEVVKATTVKSSISQVDLDSNEENNGFHQINSSMIGAFYSRPSPDKEPFVQIGSIITKNQPLCVLEAMKLLNEVHSDVDGEIIEILVNDGDIIEFGQPLFIVKASV